MRLSLSQEVIEEGREHPFVEALVKEFRSRHDELLGKLRDGLSSGASEHLLRAQAGRAAELWEVIRLIMKVEGQDERNQHL